MPSILEVEKLHPDMIVGSFDTSIEIDNGMEAGTVLLFGVDQNSYLQGYMPVALLTWYSYTEQELADIFIESGPDFIVARQSQEQIVCQELFYEVCQGSSATTPIGQGGDEGETSTDGETASRGFQTKGLFSAASSWAIIASAFVLAS